jgi:hypothetical protein
MARRRASNTRKPVNPIAYQSVMVRILTSSSIDAVILLIHTGRGDSQDVGCHIDAYKCMDGLFQPLRDPAVWK